MLELEASHTHLYPGARGRVASGRPQDGPVTLRFADGAAATGEMTAGTLRLAPHTTAAGTRIGAKAWTVRFSHGRFRVVARAEAANPSGHGPPAC